MTLHQMIERLKCDLAKAHADEEGRDKPNFYDRLAAENDLVDMTVYEFIAELGFIEEPEDTNKTMEKYPISCPNCDEGKFRIPTLADAIIGHVYCDSCDSPHQMTERDRRIRINFYQ